jgi:hypothetical protein
MQRNQAWSYALATQDAYSFNFYGPNEWKACYAMLFGRGYNSTEAIAIMRSKITRLAHDDRQGKHATGKDLERFLDSFKADNLRGHVDDYVLGMFGPDADCEFECSRCAAPITEAQAKLSLMRADDAMALCKNCVTHDLTLKVTIRLVKGNQTA